MARVLDGVYTCPEHGQFEWKTIVLEGHMESVFGYWNNIRKNVKRTTRVPNGYVLELACPKCSKRFSFDYKTDT